MNLHKCLQSFFNCLTPLIRRHVCSLSSVEICDSGYKVGNTIPTDGYRPYDGSILSGDDSHYWLRTSFRTPAAEEQEYLVVHTDLGGNAYNSQGLIYLNGEMVHGLDSNHPDVTLIDHTQMPDLFQPGHMGDFAYPRHELFVADGVHFNQDGYDVYRDIYLRVLDDIL